MGNLFWVSVNVTIVRSHSNYDLHFSANMLVKGTHFFPDVAPADLAHKILAVNLSDWIWLEYLQAR